MSYQSPIEVIHTQMQNIIDREIYREAMRVGINVDKDELLKALQYDRGQYQKGYTDRDSEIVRCKDCAYAHKTYDGDCKYCDMFTDDDGNSIERYRSGDWFCADGERKSADEKLMEEMDADPLG